MSDPYISEIRMVGYTFAPKNWANCDGSLLPIASHTALFSLIGTAYGGDGRTTVGLPNLGGRAAMQFGSGPGLTPRSRGQAVGAPSVTLSKSMMPSHFHLMVGDSTATGQTGPVGNPFGKISVGGPAAKKAYASGETTDATLASQSIGNTGGGQAHQNMQPFQAIRFIICLNGVYPSRN